MENLVPALEIGQATGAARGDDLGRTLRTLGKHADPKAVRAAAEEFEAVFLSTMLAPMFEGLGQDNMFGGGPGEETYRSLLVDEYGKSIAKSGGLGIADAVERELLRMQEVAK